MPPVERGDGLALPSGGLFETGEEREVASAERRGEVPAIEPGEVDLHLVCRASQGSDPHEVLACQLGQLVDQHRKVLNRQRHHAAFGIGH